MEASLLIGRDGSIRYERVRLTPGVRGEPVPAPELVMDAEPFFWGAVVPHEDRYARPRRRYFRFLKRVGELYLYEEMP